MSAPILVVDDVLDQADLLTMSRIADATRATHGEDHTVWLRHEQSPRCFIERVVEALRGCAPPQTTGGEWWFHMQPTDSDLALHFEKDDAAARTSGVFRQPERAMLLYLTDHGGPTLFTEQRYVSPTEVEPAVPDRYALVSPRRNRLVSFDARLYHGVLSGARGEAARAAPELPHQLVGRATDAARLPGDDRGCLVGARPGGPARSPDRARGAPRGPVPIVRRLSGYGASPSAAGDRHRTSRISASTR